MTECPHGADATPTHNATLADAAESGANLESACELDLFVLVMLCMYSMRHVDQFRVVSARYHAHLLTFSITRPRLQLCNARPCTEAASAMNVKVRKDQMIHYAWATSDVVRAQMAGRLYAGALEASASTLAAMYPAKFQTIWHASQVS